MDPDRCYLSVQSWPASFDETRRIDAIESVLHVDRFRARELARRSTPAIFGRCSQRHAGQAVEQLGQWGVEAALIPGTELALRFGAVVLKSISAPDPTTGQMVVTPRLGPPVAVDPRQILILVRGHVRAARESFHGDLGVEALHQLHGTLGADAWNQGPTRRRALEVIEVLDIHLADGRHYRVQGDQFSYDVLGNSKGESVRQNVDALTGLLAQWSGRAVVDRDFENCRHLAEFVHDFASGDARRGMSAFGLYSAWKASLAARHAAG